MMRRLQDRQLDAVQPGRMLGNAKLDEALLAGGPRASECTLILTEGDSAKTFAVSGLAVVGRDTYGVFPLKGTPLNVRGATHNQLVENAELRQVADILGLSLKAGQHDIDPAALRYGRLMIMADQVLFPLPTLI
jgi:DNA topoisomerase-2